MNDDRDEKIFGMTASKHQPNNVQTVARKLEKSVNEIAEVMQRLSEQVIDRGRLIEETVTTVT